MVYKIKSTGYYCTVCEECFDPTEKELKKVNNSYSDDALEEKLQETWENARQDFIDHWTAEHW